MKRPQMIRVQVLRSLFCTAFASAVIAFSIPAHSQVATSYYLPAEASFDSAVPSPETYLGFQVGEWHLRHDQLAGYMRTLAEKSDRVTIQSYAKTYEQRPLQLLTITSPENHRNIDALRDRHRQLSDPDQSAALDISGMPAVVWLGYSVHGNEASGSNASAMVAYYLAAGRDAFLDSLLSRTIILLDPSINPDGLSRFAQWVNMHKNRTPNPDPDHREHTELWPSGRTNHYWFDLNRDWLPVQHPESRGRITKFHEWQPLVLTDHHEMGSSSTFFFMPGIPSRNHPLTPLRVFDLTAGLAEYHAAELDKIGSLYYARESFDDFYYGKGSTYPDINGAVGILFEQASARGHLQKTDNGELSFPFAIRNQVMTSLSTLRGVLAMRTDLLEHRRTFYRTAMTESRSAPVQGYVFGAPKDPARAFELLKVLRTHQVKAHKLARDVRTASGTFSSGSAYVVPAQQPQFRLVQAMFERRTSFRDSLFYDVSAWTLPLAFGLEYAELSGRTWSERLVGAEIDVPEFPAGQFVDAETPYALAFEWHGFYAPRALYALLSRNMPARVATRPFEAETAAGRRQFDYGTIVVPVKNNTEIAAFLRREGARIAREDGLDVFMLSTGKSAGGIDLGSPSFDVLKKPSVLLVAGRGASNYEVGEIWHLLDQRYRMPVTLVEPRRFSGVSLDDYTVIVMTSGSYDRFGDRGTKNLDDWVKSGGTLIAAGSAINWGARKKLFTAEFESSSQDTSRERRAYESASRDRGARVIGGAIFRGELDRTHPLGFGYTGGAISIFRRGTIALKRSKNAYATPVVFADAPLVSGYASAENQRRLGGTAALLVSGSGRGRAILHAQNPCFRAFWFGTNKLMANSVFFGDVISGATARAE